VNVSSQPGVVGQIPAFVVRVGVNRDIVTIPIPVVGIGHVEWGDAEIEAVKPEAVGSAALDSPEVPAAETAVKAAVFPGMVEAEACVATIAVVPDPFPVAVDVRGFRVVVTVAIRMSVPVVVPVVIVPVAIVPVVVISGRTVARNVSATNVVLIVVVVVVVLRQDRRTEQQRYRNEGCDEKSGE
jgi:hypothetical protein